MTKTADRTDNDDLVVRARSEADALGRLYELYYDRIFRFCVHRLFSREAAEDITSVVFLTVARSIRTFEGQSERDFRGWLYAIAANQANAYIRKTSRRRRLLVKAVSAIAARSDSVGESQRLDWPRLYQAILELKPQHQTIVTLRFFENLEFEEIGRILNIREATVRVTLHRILVKLRGLLKSGFEGEA